MGHVLDSIGETAHSVYDTVKPVLPVLAAVAGTIAGGPAAGAAAAGLTKGATTYASNHDLRNSAANAVGTAAGSYIGGNLGNAYGSSLGTVGGAASSALGTTAGNAIGAAAPTIAGSSLGGALGSFAGGQVGGSFADSLTAPKPKIAAANPWMPTQQAQSSMPTSLTGSLSGLSPLQQSTNLASRGVYGGGNGPQEEQYFLNQENRRLVDQSGNVSDISSLSPVEMSYLQKLGLGGYGNSNDLLKAINSWQAA